MPNWAKIIEAKTALAARGAQPSKQGDNPRIPPGQSEVRDFPVLDIGQAPVLDRGQWRLQVWGLLDAPQRLDWQAIHALPQVEVCIDFHCVTRWSQLDMPWQGVLARDLVRLARPQDEAKFVTLHGADGYTTNLPLEALLDDDVIVAHSVFGAPLAHEHGGPVRLVVPKRYAWKSAKWLTGIEFHAKDRPGFWEVRGYHNDADPWREQRFSAAAL
jgi:DMSO/TMAO reductase YedYZ molybdopterin-dependent catalytic subunit